MAKQRTPIRAIWFQEWFRRARDFVAQDQMKKTGAMALEMAAECGHLEALLKGSPEKWMVSEQILRPWNQQFIIFLDETNHCFYSLLLFDINSVGADSPKRWWRPSWRRGWKQMKAMGSTRLCTQPPALESWKWSDVCRCLDGFFQPKAQSNRYDLLVTWRNSYTCWNHVHRALKQFQFQGLESCTKKKRNNKESVFLITKTKSEQ